MASGRSIASKVEDELCCPVCLELFGNPKVLTNCLHSLCEKCIGPLVTPVEDKHFVKCPTCRRDTEVPNGVTSQIPTNYILQNIILKLSLDKGDLRKLICGSCLTSESVSTHLCIECGHFLCENCSKAHRTMTYFIHHHLITVEEVTEKGVQSIPHPIMCHQHDNNQVQIFCSTCESLVCQLCALTSHKKHELEDIKSTFKRKQEDLQKRVKDGEVVVSNLEKTIRSVEKICKQLDINVEDAERKIIEEIDRLIKELEKRRGRLLQDLQGLREKKKKVLETQIKDLQLQFAEAKTVVEFSQSTLKSKIPPQFVSLEKTAKKTLKELIEKNYDLKIKETCDVHFVFKSKLEKMMKEVEEFGNILDYHPAFGPNCEIVGEEEMIQATITVNNPRGYHKKITVKTKDIDGEELRQGGANVRGVVYNKTEKTEYVVPVIDNDNGLYDLMLDINKRGSYELFIIVNNEKSINCLLSFDCWRLDQLKCVGKIELLDENLGGRGGWGGGVVGDVVFDEGFHLWNIRVDPINNINGGIVVGVCLEDEINNRKWWNKGNKWTWWYNNSNKTVIRHCPAEGLTQLHHCSKINSGDILTLFLDCQKKTLQLTNNRTNQTDVLTGVHGKVKPYFFLLELSFTLQ